MADELVERLRAHDINIATEWKDEADQSMWLDTADDLIGEAADRIEALERENATLRAERDEARKANQKLHRRVQQAERVEMMAVGICKSWYEFFVRRAFQAPRKERYFLRYIMGRITRRAAAIRNMGGGE